MAVVARELPSTTNPEKQRPLAALIILRGDPNESDDPRPDEYHLMHRRVEDVASYQTTYLGGSDTATETRPLASNLRLFPKELGTISPEIVRREPIVRYPKGYNMGEAQIEPTEEVV